MITEDIEDIDDEEEGMFYACPNCGRAYDEIDYEYQICHYCKWEAKCPAELD